MATIAGTAMTGLGSRAVTETTLTASDTFTYEAGTGQILIIRNDTGGAITVTIDGDGGSTVAVPGIGDVDVSSGYSTGSIADGNLVAIPLDTIKRYLTGTIAVTGGSGAEAVLLNSVK